MALSVLPACVLDPSLGEMTHHLEINQIVPSGEFYLKIVEANLTGDDDIGFIDMSEDMEIDRTRNIQDASYDITYFVQSISV